MVFFSKNKKTAIARINKLAKQDTYYKGKVPVLAKKQITHLNKWKTWDLKKKKCLSCPVARKALQK